MDKKVCVAQFRYAKIIEDIASSTNPNLKYLKSSSFKNYIQMHASDVKNQSLMNFRNYITNNTDLPKQTHSISISDNDVADVINEFYEQVYMAKHS